jgi:anti-sigma factor RsiW
MNCLQAEPLVAAYADGELDPVHALELERHLQDCPACTRAWRELQSLKKAVGREALYFPAPAELRSNLLAELRTQTGRQPSAPFWNVRSWNWLGTAMSGATLACLALLLAVSLSRPSGRDQLAQELVSGHIRSLMANHALDVVSTDQHTVKPWFDGKLDFAPPVKDLAAQEFPLIGGRLDYLGNRAVAALVFQRHKHLINLFIWPGTETATPPAAVAPRQGYNLVHWTQAGMTCWAVSDLNEQELLEFARDFAS